jgi:hypothetical protein
MTTGSVPRLTPLSDDLQQLLVRAGGKPMSLRAVFDAVEERGTALVVILLAAPFVAPIPLPGLSLPFGVALAVLGIRLGLGLRPWLPDVLLRRQLSYPVLARLVGAAVRVAGPVERRVRPRWPGFFSPDMCLVNGVAIAVAALLLMPPFPMPGINALPSLAIVLLGLGMMERDGGAVVTGYVVLVVAYAYLYLWWDVAMRAIRYLPAV